MERQLSGWTPRQPSERIERELFERPQIAIPSRSTAIEIWRRGLVRLLGPAGAMAMVFVVMLFQIPPRGSHSTIVAAATNAPMAMLSTGVALPPLYHHSVLNHCDYPIFGWTNSALPAEGIAHFRK